MGGVGRTHKLWRGVKRRGNVRVVGQLHMREQRLVLLLYSSTVPGRAYECPLFDGLQWYIVPAVSATEGAWVVQKVCMCVWHGP
jgi:hypothetical protein